MANLCRQKWVSGGRGCEGPYWEDEVLKLITMMSAQLGKFTLKIIERGPGTDDFHVRCETCFYKVAPFRKSGFNMSQLAPSHAAWTPHTTSTGSCRPHPHPPFHGQKQAQKGSVLQTQAPIPLCLVPSSTPHSGLKGTSRFSRGSLEAPGCL